MNEKAWIQIIYFFFMIPMNWFSCQWIWTLVCRAAGVTRQEVRKYRIENHQEIHPQRKVYDWLVNKSENPKQFKKLLSIYRICTMPSLICFSLAIIGCFTHALDTILDNASIIMPMIIVAVAFVGALYNRITK